MNTDRQVDIYIITNLINGKQYVGQTVSGYKERFRQHCLYANGCYTDGEYVQVIDKAIKKYGIDNFKVEVIEQVPYKDKDDKEKYYIERYNTFKEGYNRTLGGDFNPMFDDEVKKRHKEICSSEEHRQRQRESAIKLFSEREDIHIKITEGNKRAWKNYDSAKREQILKGLTQYNNERKQRVACVDKNDNIIKEFESESEACRFTGRDSGEAGNLLKSCNEYIKSGKRRVKLFGYYWIKL